MIHAASPPTLCLPQSSGSYSQCLAPTLVTQHCEVAEWLSPSLWRTLFFVILLQVRTSWVILTSFLSEKLHAQENSHTFFTKHRMATKQVCTIVCKDFNWWLIVRVMMRPEFWHLLIDSHGLEWRAVPTCDPLSSSEPPLKTKHFRRHHQGGFLLMNKTFFFFFLDFSSFCIFPNPTIKQTSSQRLPWRRECHDFKHRSGERFRNTTCVFCYFYGGQLLSSCLRNRFFFLSFKEDEVGRLPWNLPTGSGSRLLFSTFSLFLFSSD